MKKYKFSMLQYIRFDYIVGLWRFIYPMMRRKGFNQIPDLDSLSSIQRAIDQYQQDTGVLPIKNSEMDTDIFIKYQIDFSKLVQNGYFANSPDNSYEKGGIFQYIIWNPEENPTVKLVDLRMTERLREVNITFYVNKISTTYKERIADYVYTINYDKSVTITDVTVAKSVFK